MHYVIFTSHRSRDLALRLLDGPKPKSYYSWTRETGKGVYALTDAQLAILKNAFRLKGWRILRAPYDDLLECINW